MDKQRQHNPAVAPVEVIIELRKGLEEFLRASSPQTYKEPCWKRRGLRVWRRLCCESAGSGLLGGSAAARGSVAAMGSAAAAVAPLAPMLAIPI
jgi:hypothetical protein